MGQKVHPTGFRVGVILNWRSRWFVKGRKFADNIKEDYELRAYIKKKLKGAGVSKVEIERTVSHVKLIIYTSRPGIVIGKKGVGIDSLTEDIQKQTPNKVVVDIQEVRKPDVEAQLIAENVALQLEKRVSWRRVLKKAIAGAVRRGVRGVKVRISGRLDGAEIARSEWYNEKQVPLHTLRANIDYGVATAFTTYGTTGVKVWVYNGDVYRRKDIKPENNFAKS
ncbi:MAG: 30S ribosomal protein S3 [Bdellovibrionales bacterium]|nr:30S ribosomal protein S3 [Bdellovibrionales bacterium]